MGTLVNILLIILLSVLLSCDGNSESQAVPEYVLNRYREFSAYTDPGEYAHLYDGLPESHRALCDIVEAQLVHPVEIRSNEIEVPEGREYEDTVYVNVAEMLGALVKHNPDGFIRNRRFEDKLYVACVHHAMLYASIMKHRGVPARLRAGFAPYIGESLGIDGLHTGHAVTEVWDESKKQWILIDPDLKMVDFERKRFESPANVWLAYRSGRVEIDETYRSYRGHGYFALMHMLCLDLRFILNNEISYWHDPPLAIDAELDIEKIEPDKLEVLDRLAELMREPDINLEELADLYAEYEYLRPKE